MRFIRYLIWLTGLLVSAAHAADEDLLYEERLLPPVTAYVDLLLCANTAQEYRNDNVDAERYQRAAFEVQDLTDEAGWSSSVVAATMTKLQENRSDLDLREDDSPESFYRRNFSGERCERQLEKVRVYRENGVPSP